MKSTLLPLISATLLSLCSGWFNCFCYENIEANTPRVTIAVPEPIIDIDPAVAVARRALPNAPDGYTPKGETCPDNRPVVRSAATLSTNETSWLEKRRNNTIQPMKDFLSRANITGFDASSYIDQHSGNASTLPNIAIAVSGGGYRALMNGGGALQAFDSRTENSTAAGHLGGLLQSSTYLAGLSGGGWLVGSIYLNNFTTVTALRDEPSGSVWEFGNSVIEGPEKSGVQILNTAEYYVNLEDAVSGKADAGFNTTITDYCEHLVPDLLRASY
jgi:lysophospholipase